MKRLLLILLLLPSFSDAQIITTIAGNGCGPVSGDGGPATAAGISRVSSGAFDKYGNYYFSQPTCVRKISTTGIISTFAGGGTGGDGVPATAALLDYPAWIAIDSGGNMYISEYPKNRIRKIDGSSGIISTIAGNGTPGYSGDGGPASSSVLNYPNEICMDKSGNLYITDDGNYRIRKINTLGIITTIVGTGVAGVSGDGGPATAATISTTQGICSDDENNLYIGGTQRIRKINTSGVISTIAGDGTAGSTGDGGPATNAKLCPYVLQTDHYGNLYICDIGYDNIRVINSSGFITTIAGNGIIGYSGDGGQADSAELDKSEGIVADSCGNLYIADTYNCRIRKVTFPRCGYEYVKSINNSHCMTSYPNPATTSLTIASSDKITSVAISNLVGHTLYNQQYNAPQVQVDVADLPSGMYLVRINGTEVRKFVKQ